MSEQLDRLIAFGMIVALAFTALAHGAVEAWSVAIFELLVLVLLLLWAIKAVADQRLVLRVPATLLPLGALIALGLAQGVVVTDKAGKRWSLSLDVEATRTAVIVLVFLFIAALVAANFWVSRERLNLLQKFLTVYGLALAVFGLVQYFAWDGRFYWLRQAPADEVTSPFGPFVSHSHFAGYLELLTPIPVALLITRGVRREARLFYGFAAVMMGIAILASLSRGGMIGIAAEMITLVAFGVQWARNREAWASAYEPTADSRPSDFALASRLRARAWVVGAVITAVALGILWIGPEPLMKRAGQARVTGEDPQAETFFASRGWIWRDTLAMIRSNPITGVGLGAYETAFPAYSHGDGSLLVGEAHNDYLQVLADGGLIGGALALWFIMVVLRSVVRGLRARDPLCAGLAMGAGAGITGMLAHSFFDFNLQLPAHALLFLLLSAVVSHLGAKATEPAVALTEPAEPRRDVLLSATGH